MTSRSELTWLFDVFVLLLFSLEIMGRLPPPAASRNNEQGWLRQSKAQSMGKNVSRSSIFLRHGLIFALLGWVEGCETKNWWLQWHNNFLFVVMFTIVLVFLLPLFMGLRCLLAENQLFLCFLIKLLHCNPQPLWARWSLKLNSRTWKWGKFVRNTRNVYHLWKFGKLFCGFNWWWTYNSKAQKI